VSLGTIFLALYSSWAQRNFHVNVVYAVGAGVLFLAFIVPPLSLRLVSFKSNKAMSEESL